MNLPADAPQYLWVLVIIAPIVGTWITTRGQRRQDGVIAEVREQVANTHTTNLREDLDAIHADVRGIRTDVQDLRAEVRDVRGRTYDVEVSLRDHLRTG